MVQYKVLLPVAEQGAAAYKVSFMWVRGWVEEERGRGGGEDGVRVGGWMVLRYWIKPWCLWWWWSGDGGGDEGVKPKAWLWIGWKRPHRALIASRRARETEGDG